MSLVPVEPPRLRQVRARPVTPRGRVLLPKLDSYRLRLTLIGTTPLVMQAFSETAKAKILAKHLHVPRLGPKKPARDFEVEYDACFHRNRQGQPAIPREAIHAALIGTAHDADLDKITVKKWIVLEQGFYPIIGPAPTRRLDFPRIPTTGQPYPVYRPRWWPWSLQVSLVFYRPRLQHAEILRLVQLAGIGGGLGEGRPNTKRGNVVKGWGRFRVDPKVILEPVASMDEMLEAQTWEEVADDV
jgi:hypothetical protein